MKYSLVVTLSLGLLSLPLLAQNPKRSHIITVLPESKTAPQIVSADVLRHPISQKTRRMLQRAMDWMRSGKHREAIEQLEETLSKDPASAPYVHSLLGFEFMRTDQYAAAVSSFDQAVALLPHDPINRTNYGVALAAVGDYERAEEQVRVARELDPENPNIRLCADAIARSRRSEAR